MKNNDAKKKHAHHLATLATLALIAAVPDAGAQAAAEDTLVAQARTRSRAAAPRRPTQEPSFIAADAGYKAFDRKDYAEAVSRAEEAVRLAPSNRAYWLLLVNSLIAANRLADAEQAIARATAAAGGDASLTQAATTIRSAQAQAAGTEMYLALNGADVPRAIAQARTAVGLAPEHPGYRLALVYALLRGNQFAEADRVAGETIALLPDATAPLALRAYARQQLGRNADAQADIDRALQQRNLPAQVGRELRLMGADAALAARAPQRAIDLLAPLPQSDAAVAGRFALAKQMASTPSMAAVAFPAPAIDCSRVDTSQTCAVLAGAAPSDPGYLAAAAAYRAVEARDYAQALVQARVAVASSPGNRDYQLLLMNAALQEKQYAEAEAAATAAMALNPQDYTVVAQRANIRRAAGNIAGANEDARAALQAGSLPPLEAAYLASQLKDDRAATQWFAQADANRSLPVTSLQDAGYAAMRANQDEQAVDYFKRSVDAVEAATLKMDKQMLFDTRRTISEVERKFGVLASLTYRRGGGASPGFGVGPPTPGAMNTVQVGAEAYWRPWGFRNGRFVELFLRGFETLRSEGVGATGSESFQGAFGARWKPLTEHNLVLSFARLFGKNLTSDYLAQIAYSYDYGTDLRVDVPNWWTTRIAAEVGKYLHPSSQHYGLASVMVGRSFRLGGELSRSVLFPHAVLAAEYNSAFLEKSTVGFGPGISFRQWFREDKYHAPQSYWDLTLQYRLHVGGDDRIKGPYFNALISY